MGRARCQNLATGEVLVFETGQEETVRELVTRIQERTMAAADGSTSTAMPFLLANPGVELRDRLTRRAAWLDDLVILPDDILVRDVLAGLTDDRLPLYFSTRSTDPAILQRFRDVRLAIAGLDAASLHLKRIVVGGVGLLGGGIARDLALNGVSTIVALDRGYVDWPNLFRQPLFGWEDLYTRKVDAAKRALEILGGVEVIPVFSDVPSWRTVMAREREDVIKSMEKVEDLVANSNLVIGTFDSFSARSALQIACLLHDRPFLSAAVESGDGSVSVHMPDRDPCYACGLPDPRRGTWLDEGDCTIATPDAQGVITAIATRLSLAILLDSPPQQTRVLYSGRKTGLSMLTFRRSDKCILCGPEGVRSWGLTAGECFLRWIGARSDQEPA